MLTANNSIFGAQRRKARTSSKNSISFSSLAKARRQRWRCVRVVMKGRKDVDGESQPDPGSQMRSFVTEDNELCLSSSVADVNVDSCERSTYDSKMSSEGHADGSRMGSEWLR